MSSSRARPCAVLALIATAAAGLLLSGCGTTEGLFSLKSLPEENVQLSASQAITATQEWAAAYAKNPEEPRNVIGYARALRALGSDDKALEILKAAFRTNPTNGDIATELGRLALEMNHLEIAKPALEMADQQAIRDWKTLSAQGTLRAKQGQYDQAQQYYLAALESQPDAVSVINNLALAYMLDGKAQKAEELLRKAVSNGQKDKRLSQNLALVLGLQGKFAEARQYASADMSETDVKANMAYLRNMVSSPTQTAAVTAETPDHNPPSHDDWRPFASSSTGEDTTAGEAKPTAKVQMIKPVANVEAPAVRPGKTIPTPSLAGRPPTTSAQVQAASLLRADLD
jgi:Flp pilus assembly protein TadD